MSYSKIALIISLFCATYCILYECVFLKQEAFNTFFYALGVVTNCVALSVIASCIFYFITDYFPKRHQMDQIHDFITHQLESMKNLGEQAFLDITDKKEIGQSEFLEKCNKDLKTHYTCTTYSNAYDWFDYFTKLHEKEDEIIKQTLAFESLLPVEVKLKFIELKKIDSGLRNINYYKKLYDENVKKRTINVYANEIYSHLYIMTNILNTYNKTSKI